MHARVQDIGYGAHGARQRGVNEFQAPVGRDQRAASLLLLPRGRWAGKHVRAELEVSPSDELLASVAPSRRGTTWREPLQASWVTSIDPSTPILGETIATPIPACLLLPALVL